MKRMIFAISVVSIVGISLMSPFWLGAQPGRQAGRRPDRPQGEMQQQRPQGGPPPEALQACQHKQDGDACQFESPHGAISGTCQLLQTQMACVPEGMGPGGPQGGRQGGLQQEQARQPGQQDQLPDERQQRPQRLQQTQSLAPYTEATPVATTIVDTGQTQCYGARREITCPAEGEAFSGQDAQYESQAPAYRDNGDGTVTDLNTGLMWQQVPGEKMTYDQAVAGAASFDLAGYTDWRLPTITELYSLIVFSGVNPGRETTPETGAPFIDADYFVFEYGDTDAGERLIDAQYASATTYVSTTMNGAETMFGVNFADGRIKGYGLSDPRGRGEKEFFVLYVRGSTGYGANEFQDNGDGTITDTATGLLWMQADSGAGMEWEAALSYCEELDYAGYTDWRLPNAKELQSLVDYTRSPATTNSAAIDPLFSTSVITDESGNPNYPFYWTSTTHVNSEQMADNAVYIAFGEALGWMQTPTGNVELMDVHGAGAQRSDPKTGDADDYPQGRGPQGDVIRINNYVRCVR